MKSLIQYLKTKNFYRQLLLASVLALLILWGAFKLIGLFTKHGEVVIVPEFTGQSIADLDNFISDKNVRYEIIDSIYSPNDKPGVVIRQEPEKNSEVKHNRIIYLYVTSLLPPQIVMPKLVDRSLRQATAMIESYGLKLGKTQYVADACSNCILKQFFKGKEIAAGVSIKKGSVIDLHVGKGLIEFSSAAVPDVIGLKYCEAKQKIKDAALTIGSVVPDTQIKDSCNTFVYKQSPEANSSSSGNVILYLTTDKSKIELFKPKNKDNDFDDDDDKP